jgi:hypothetical protein
MRNYLEFMINQPFYVKNKEYLESYTLKCKNLSSLRLQGLRNLWCMSPKFVEWFFFALYSFTKPFQKIDLKWLNEDLLNLGLGSSHYNCIMSLN